MLRYKVQGSAPEPYLVTFEGEGMGLAAFCSCPAGGKRLFCKHVASLLIGDVSKLVEPSDDPAALVSRAAGSPLLKKAEAHMLSKQKLQPFEGICSIQDISSLIAPLLHDTEFWSELSSAEDGSEFLRVYMRKMYKNGKPYKKPTILATVSYEPFIYDHVYDFATDDIQSVARKRARPYLVDRINYGNIKIAAANFVEKLKSVLAQLQRSKMAELAAIAEAKRNAPVPPEKQPRLTPEELQRRNTARKAAMRAKPVTQEVLGAAHAIIDALSGKLPPGSGLAGQDRAKYYAIDLLPKRQWLCRLHYKTKNKYVELPGEDMVKVDTFESMDMFIATMAAMLEKMR